jgi:hypothetical protein
MQIHQIQEKRLFLFFALVLAGAFFAFECSFPSAAQTQTLLSDNFEDGNADGWQKSGGSWAVVTDGSLVYRQTGTSSDARIRNGSTAWTDYALQARVKPLAFGGTGRYIALTTRVVNTNHFYYLALVNGNQLILAKRDGGTSTTLASQTFTVTLGTFYTLRIEAQGATLRGLVNGALLLTATDSQFSAGNIGGATCYASGEFDDFLVSSLSGPTPQPPLAPTGLVAAPGNQQAILSWNASSGATGYNVKRSTTSGGPYTIVGGGSSTSLSNIGLINGVTYYYVVSATNSAGESSNSAQVAVTPTASTTPPAAPTGLAASAGNAQVALSWTASSGATAYNVKRSTASGGPYSLIGGGSSTSFSSTGLTNGVSYYFVVSATNSAGESANSNQVSATPAAPPTSTGDLFVATNGTDSNPGTIEQPTTLSSAITRIAVGGTIFMRGGTYNYSATVTIARGNDGTSSQTKKIFAYSNETPVLNFSAQAFASNNRGVQLFAHFWHLRGLEVTGAGDNGIFIGGNNNTIERCVTHHNRDSGLQLSRYASTAAESEWPANNLILNCTSYDNYDPDNGEDADGFACKLTTGPGNVFRGCIAHHNIDDGWDLYTKGDTGAIGAVTIENCVSYNNGTLSTGGTTTDSDGNGFKLGGEDIAVNHIVRRSIAFGNKKHGFTYNRNPGTITVTNNTSWGNAESNLKFDDGSHIFTNNLSLQSGDSDKFSGTDVANTNCWWINNISVNGKGLVVSAADFVSLSVMITRNADGSVNLGNFLRLAAGSDLINAGSPSGTDIGAVESQ